MMRSPLWLALAFTVAFIAPSANAAPPARTVVPLAANWRFHLGETTGAVENAASDAAWPQVFVPHSWTNAEAVPGKGFFAGESWYTERFAAQPAWRSRRVFLRFEAVSLLAEVWLNGHRLGEHHGGFAAFTYEITDALQFGAENRLVVRVDNRRRPDISPLGGDFTIFGGIYRPVSLLVTDKVDITPLDHASPGVFLKQTAVTNEQATVDITTELSNATQSAVPTQVRITLADAAGKQLQTHTTAASAAPGEITPTIQALVIDRPHLWNGVADPYLYSVRVDLLEGGRVIDSVTQPLGLRFFHVDPRLGFVLNGKPQQIHGVCLHQEIDSHGWAVTPAEERNDLRLIREMGATGIRLVHYQHSQNVLNEADRMGLLIWAELTQVDHVNDTPAYHENIRQQLVELIRQNYNHPSIFVWSLYNELNAGTKAISTPLIAELNDLAHKEDPTRPTTGAASADTIANMHEQVASADLISDNNYAGWYGQQPSRMGEEIDKWNKAYGYRGLSISEYGGGAAIDQHRQHLVAGDVKPGGPFHPEEWQSLVHEGNYLAISTRPEVWGSFLWVMFDFASIGRHEGTIDGQNDKGLITRDRLVKKDAFFFYQANWTTAPMAYLTSRRDTQRTEATTEVKVYSNQPSVSLTINGKIIGPGTERQPHVFVWPAVTLTPGNNQIKASTPNGTTDTCQWTYAGAP